MTAADLRSDLEIARLAAIAAGEIGMRYFRADPAVTLKSPDQPVTAADLEADLELRRRLTEARPGYGWLSEETADGPARLACERVWVVDPIDGTNSFIAGRPEFVVSVGLVEHGVAVAGVLHNPATGETYTAARGAGARLDGRAIRVAGCPAPGEERVLIASRTELALDAFREYAAGWRILPLGSTAYRMAKVAEGVGHLYLSRGKKNEWDVCAAAVLVEEAGGTVTQHDGAPLEFNRRVPVLSGVVASCGLPPGA